MERNDVCSPVHSTAAIMAAMAAGQPLPAAAAPDPPTADSTSPSGQHQHPDDADDDEILPDPPVAPSPVAAMATPDSAVPDSVPSHGVASGGGPGAVGSDGYPHPESPPSKGTAVDGKGMWRSWTRVFAKPESACLDLLDNCFDAALKPGFEGRVTMESQGTNIVRIMNNSQTPIKRLEAALTVYKSSKNADLEEDDHKDSIGENGVGLKQGCATLSDCSIVLTRNFWTLEIGIIAKGLQSSHGVFLPSFSFNVRDSSEIGTILQKWLAKNPAIVDVLTEAFGPDVDVVDQVTQFAESLVMNQWYNEDHVFLLVLCKLKKSADKVPHELIQTVNPAKTFLQDIKAILPEYYINLPAVGMFDFIIDQERVDFSYWQKRLVELTKFVVYIPTEQSFDELPEDSWDQPVTTADGGGGGKHPLSIYCGFDAYRVDKDMRLKTGTSACMLYIHSCQAGRLIKKEIDARHMLGLSSSGVDYTQGLTVIINDIGGKLPLTPTKDGIAWSERTNGETHQRNLLSWTGAVAQAFWNQHKNRFGGKGSNKVKELMKKTIRSFAEDDSDSDNDDDDSDEDEEGKKGNAAATMKNLEDSQFTKFDGIKWNRVQANFDNRWKIRKASKPFTISKGPDTLHSITSERMQRARDGKSRKRKRKAPPTNSAAESRRSRRARRDSDNNTSDDGGGGSGIPGSRWRDVEQDDITRVTLGVLEYLRDKDREKLFENPVLEAIPDQKEEYLEVVAKPMDFKTIESERLQAYNNVSELRKDLVLTFENCIIYNGINSKYGIIAQQMLDRLDEAFESTDIKQVTMGMLSYLRELDERELFEEPVLEQIPEIKKNYLQVVSTPMDFKTIEEERVDTYTSIDDLRDDLELIFQNCIAFNGPKSPYSAIAQEMLDRLDDAFDDIVMGKKRRKKAVNYDEIIGQYQEDDDSEDGDGSETGATGTSKRKKPTPRKKPTSAKKKIPYNTLQKRLRLAEKQVEELTKQLKVRDARIKQLEGQQKGSKKNGQHKSEGNRATTTKNGRIRASKSVLT